MLQFMKHYLKTLVIVAVAGFICQQAGATPTPVPDTVYNSTEVRLNGTAPPPSFPITSEAVYETSGPYNGEFEYTYKLLSATPDISGFTVFDVQNGGSIVDVTGTGQFSGMEHTTHVSWTEFGGGDDNGGAVTLTFISPYAPIWGYSSTMDAEQWSDGGITAVPGGDDIVGDYGVVVPGDSRPGSPVPDGGLTVSLLGGALLVLGAFRRKLG